MRNVLTMATALAALACSRNAPPTIPGTLPPPVQWKLAWSDEFDGAAGTGVDAGKWTHDIGDGCTAGICGWGNQEKEYYSNATENVALNGSGQLAITARTAPAGLTCYYGACRYTSAKIHTRGKMNAAPGRVEARIKLPTGQGLWPAFWMLGSGFPATPWPQCGELDIMEFKGSQPSMMSSAIHGPGYSGATPFAHAQSMSPAEYHVFSIIWDANSVQFFVDDAMHYTVTRNELETKGASVLSNSYFVILNLAVGGHFDGDPASDAIFPATMLVDYVRVYTRSP
jgi:beta-glucanase (GH16 family)